MNKSPNANTLLGIKLFRERENGQFEIIRITRVYNPEKVRITDEEGNTSKKSLQDIKDAGFQILESVGAITFSIVDIGKNRDVVVTLLRRTDAMMGLNVPCVICRQSVTDFFYSVLSQEYDHGRVGVSASEKTCPSNIPYGDLLICDGIVISNMVQVYYNDTMDSVLDCISVVKYNDVLRELYDKHVEASKNPILKFKNSDKGWCTTLQLLLMENNFWIDVDQAFNITDVDFDIKNYIIEKEDEAGRGYHSLTNDALRFFSSTFQLNMVDCIITEYDYDIDLGEYRNECYVMIRDMTEKLYLMVYRVEGTYLEQDLAIRKEKELLAQHFRLKIFDKYK